MVVLLNSGRARRGAARMIPTRLEDRSSEPQQTLKPVLFVFNLRLLTFVYVAESPVRSHVSSNGYYGYEPHNGSAFSAKVSSDQDSGMEMDTEDAALPPQMNGFHGAAVNGHRIPNGLSCARTPKLFANGAQLTNGFGGDITLSEDVSQNRVPIAGKKRSREEVDLVQQTKRVRTEGECLLPSKARRRQRKDLDDSTTKNFSFS